MIKSAALNLLLVGLVLLPPVSLSFAGKGDSPGMVAARARMVASLERTLAEGYGIRDEAVLRAMNRVPRHLFVPAQQQRRAYENIPLPIGFGQTISQPFVVAYMTHIVGIDESSRVLEIGSGSGYQAAVLAEITDEVYTIEIVPQLAQWAEDRLTFAGYVKVKTKQADGYHGWMDKAPFDAIVVTAASPHIPPPLIGQLKDGGRMIIPVGSAYLTQQLVLVEKHGDDIRTRNLLPVRFVPFTRASEP
ncbi:MAG: protein-L-isoaspartate(D-aspartate) O-methyltransferase [Syntrophales bacterium]|nr:protein-L-isoaspartate(D-aspartate) O-methyltransferase [Syntrophales bacterium]